MRPSRPETRHREKPITYTLCKRSRQSAFIRRKSRDVKTPEACLAGLRADHDSETVYADKLSIVYDDIHLARSTQNTIREFIRNHPTVYCSTHTPLGYENLEAKRVMDLDNPPATIWPTEDYFVTNEETGKYICSICGYVYDPAEHDGVAFEDLPDDWKCSRCKQPKEKFNKA